MDVKHTYRTVVASMLLAVVSTLSAKADDAAAWRALAEPRTHVLMRHAEAPGTGDPANFRLGDCTTQRNLSQSGRDQARRIGEAVGSQQIRVDRVLTSQWCRAVDTATLLNLGPVTEAPALNSFFGARQTAESQSRDIRQTLTQLDQDGARAVLVTHQVNITALTDVFPASGEMIVVRMSQGEVQVVERLIID